MPKKPVATAVIDVEFEQLPKEITGLERYSRALILIRMRGRPVGQTTLPLIGGRIDGAELGDAVVDAAAWPLLERRLHDYLEWEEERLDSFIPPKATVAVCTRDRPDDLRRCLDALMRLPDDGQEILVVDNCPSTETTRRAVESYGHIRYIREDRPGASAARNRALREAKHEIVAFSDDDTTPDPGWLRALLRNFKDPLVMCVTGLTMPLELETEAQDWFERHTPFGRGFKRFVLEGTGRNPLHVAPAGTSANMALRKSVREYVGYFDEALGPGTPAKTGEDYDLFSRILTSGYRIVYEPRALSWHRHRRTWKELRHTVYGYGVGVYAFLTKSMLVQGEFSAPSIAWGWLRYNQLPSLVSSMLRRPNCKPIDLLIAEIRGCIFGPWAYLVARRQVYKRKDRHGNQYS
jgi:GT2 family glycosyltransferase